MRNYINRAPEAAPGRTGMCMKMSLFLFILLTLICPAAVLAKEAAPEDLTSQVLLVRDGVEIEYFQVLSFEGGGRADYFRIANKSGEPRIINMEDFLMNGKVRADLNIWEHLEPGQEVYTACDDLTAAYCLMEGSLGGLESLDLKAYISYWESGTGMDDVPRFDAALHASLIPTNDLRYHFIPSMDMMAGEQTLAAENGLLIRLLGCGSYLGSSSSYPITGILCLENQTDEDVTYGVYAAKINGFTAEIRQSGYESDSLPPAGKRFMKFYIPDSELEKASITSIGSLELQILTDPEENTGTFRTKGGKWYPVKLSMHGATSDNFDQGTVIYEDDYIRIGYRGGEVTWNDYNGLFDPAGSCVWNLAFYNKSDVALEPEVRDLVLTDPGDAEPDHSPYMSAFDLAPGAVKYEAIRMHIEEKISLPEISFKFRILTQGGGTLLAESKEPVTLGK